MHAAQAEFFHRWIAANPDRIQGANVVEFGSFNINGSLRSFFFGWKNWIGIDGVVGTCFPSPPVRTSACICLTPGADPHHFPCVQIIGSTNAVPLASHSQDIVISSNHLEHDPDMEASIREAARILVPGGVFVMTTVTALVPEHELWTTGFYNQLQVEDLDPLLTKYFPRVERVLWDNAVEDIQALCYPSPDPAENAR